MEAKADSINHMAILSNPMSCAPVLQEYRSDIYLGSHSYKLKTAQMSSYPLECFMSVNPGAVRHVLPPLPKEHGTGLAPPRAPFLSIVYCKGCTEPVSSLPDLHVCRAASLETQLSAEAARFADACLLQAPVPMWEGGRAGGVVVEPR